jgi:DNA-binding NarL/FixJ family response regulator
MPRRTTPVMETLTSRALREIPVLVAADLRLVAEAARTGLASCGLRPIPVDWPVATNSSIDLASDVETGLLLSDLCNARQVLEASGVIRSVRVRWIVQTSAPRGESWGAVLAAGATAVVPVALTLAEVTDVLHGEVADGFAISEPERADLVRMWRAADVRRSDLLLRIRRLSDREMETLRLLYSGDGVRTIAVRLGISEPTVRSRVRSILSKLGLRSTLAAVAAYGELRHMVAEDGRPGM